MKYQDTIFEKSLVVITAILGICALLDDSFFIPYVLWLFPLVVIQMIHSIFITVNYRKNKKILAAILLYRIAVATNIYLLATTKQPTKKIDDSTFLNSWMPLLIAAYLWLITWYFHREALVIEKEKKRQKQTAKQQSIGS